MVSEIIQIRKYRRLGRNMIIVCEDTKTAPNYLIALRKESIEKGFWDAIEIYPEPKPDEENDKNTQNEHKTPRKKRQLRTADEEEWVDIELEQEYAVQPVRYVRTVQKAIADGSYSEGWAVFDLDKHPAQERAAVIAAEIPVVNIAFSSRSIEMWFLLHFYQTQTIFQKTICKEGKKELTCNKVISCKDDGKGDCLIGFLRRNVKELEGYGKSKNIYSILEPHLVKAITNAIGLRKRYPVSLWYYECNPYTTMDLLVKSMLNLKTDGDEVTINKFKIKVLRTQPNILLNIELKAENRQILNKQHFCFEDSAINFDLIGDGIFEPNESRLITILPYKGAQSSKLKFPANNETDFIWILPIKMDTLITQENEDIATIEKTNMLAQSQI